MKNFTKKRGFFAAAAALLALTAMLVTTWCSSDIGGNNADEFVLPEGKGAVKLSFNNEIARTILPGDITGISDFYQFDFTFTPKVTGVGTYTKVTKLLASRTDAIILDPGAYDLTVVGYVDVNKVSDLGNPAPQPMATTASPVTVDIVAGRIETKLVVLKAYAPNGTDTGIFSYTLTAITGGFENGDTATMLLTMIDGSVTYPTDGTPIGIKSFFGDGIAHTITLTAGYYYVDFVLHVGNDTVTFRYIAHIYKDMTSSYTFTVSLNYFNAVFQFGNTSITFDMSDKKPEIEYHNGTNWVDYTPQSFTRGTSIRFRVKDAADIYRETSSGVYGIKWYCLTNTALTTVAGVTTVSADNTELTIITTGITTGPNAGNPDPANPFSIAKTYNLTVEGTADDDGKQYATVVDFTVEQP